MNRSILVRELKMAGVSLKGWMPVFQCDACKHRWEPFHAIVGSSATTASSDCWKCPNNCNATAQTSQEMQAVIPRYVVIDEIPGMIFGDEDLREFERYVRSMDATEVPNRTAKTQ
jgi:hypothetical protein